MSTRRQGVPLAALFLLIAAVAVVMALVGAAYRDQAVLQKNGAEDLAGLCALVGVVVGFVSGLGQPRYVRAALLGGVVGAILGGLVGPLFVYGPHPGATAGGAAILVISGVFLRTSGKR